MDSYNPDVQERIKKAVCAQIEYLDANGGSRGMDDGQIFRVQALESLIIPRLLELPETRDNPSIPPGQGGFLPLQGFYTEEAGAYEGNSKVFVDT